MEEDILRLITLGTYDNKIEIYDRRKQQIVDDNREKMERGIAI